MEYEYDEGKSQKNFKERDISFSLVDQFDFESALIATDIRKEYAEERFIAVGRINQRVYVLVYTMRGENLRVISLRKANCREVKYYEKET